MPRTNDPSRDLLFGLLALQNGLIDQGALFAAFATWTRDKARSLADHLVDLGHLDAPRRAVVEAIAGLHVQALGGDPGKSLAALSIGPSICQKLAQAGGPDVEATLGQVGSGHGSTQNDDEDPERTGAYSVGSATSDGQRFRILRHHAKGGLGAVFVALDGELNREVALKQILEKYADDAVSRQRFVAEAEITGGLEHPGVVPVYGLGTDAGGRPYYAMRFIKGDSLKEAIDRFHKDEGLQKDPGRRSLELRKLLRRFTDVCNAIDYAHSRGVIHRDLKPANIILGKHGETLVVDWGLAKAVGRADPSVGEQTIAPSSGGSSETLPGSALGTPAYMSPEQARGDLNRLGPRSDVYSLGATLYCLLTGKPPFESDDIGGILRAAQEGQFPRPSQRDPSLDRALEAVCLKAMATLPEGRYATPKTLADDLELWMADEPVTAWREPFSRRARRWSRRNRTAVTSLAASVLVALAGTGAVLAVQTHSNGRLVRANGALEVANGRVTEANAELKSANAREKERFNLAMDAIKLFHGEVSEDLLMKERQFDTLRNKLLKGAADFYGRLEGLLKDQTDRESRAALGKAYDELGELTAKIGDQSAALAVHRKALAVRRALASDPGADFESKLDEARSLLAVGVLLQTTGRLDAAMESFDQARSLSGGLADLSPDSGPTRVVLAYSLYRIGAVFREKLKPAEELAAYGRAQRVFHKLFETNPGDIQAQRGFAWCENDTGNVLWTEGRTSEALAAYERSRQIKERVVEKLPGEAEYQRDLAIAHQNIADLLSATGRRAEALANYERAQALRQRVADKNSAVTLFQRDLSFSHQSTGGMLLQTGDQAGARAAFGKALAIQQRLADDNPNVTDYQSGLALSHDHFGLLLSRNGDPAGALAAFAKALAIQQKLADADPGVSWFQADVAHNLLNMGWVLAQSGKPGESIDYFSREEAIRKTLADANPSSLDYRNSLANCQTNIATVLLRLGRPAEARVRCEAAVALREVLADDHPNAPNYRQGLAESLLRFGQVRLLERDRFGASTDWRRAVALYKTVPVLDGETVFLYAGCHASLSNLAGLPGTAVSAGERDALVDRAMALLRQAVEMGYRNPSAYRTETALDPLRGRDDFRALMMDLVFPTEPFARDR